MWFFKSTKTSKLNDPEIISLYKTTGDKKLIGILFDRHSHLVYGICYHYLKDKEQCKDAVLALFEKLFDDLYKYDITNFSSWMHSVARNYCFALLKKERNKTSLEEINDFIEETEDDETRITMEKKLKNLNGALQTINEEQKKCITLFYFGNKSYLEISESTGFSLNQVKSYIQNGRRNLKIYLEKKHE